STVTKLREQHNQETLVNTNKQARITSLQQIVENLTQECNSLKQSHTNSHQNNQLEALELESNNLKVPLSSRTQNKERTLRADVAKFRELYKQEVLTTSQHQLRIKLLEQDLSNLTRQNDAMKLMELQASSSQTSRDPDADVERLRAQIALLESERDHYKSEFRAQSAGQAFGYTLSGRNRTLSHVNVNAEIHHMKKQYPTYKLGQPLHTSTSDATPATGASSSTSGPSSNPTNGGSSTSEVPAQGQPATKDSRGSKHKGPRGPWVSQRPSPYVNRRNFAESDSDPDDAPHDFQRKKGKQRATTIESGSEESEESSSDDDSSDSEDELIESDVSHTAAR
ncbi:MAG: hypothetical protein NXY57DRAFT_1044937, partial [Lentinula lateritia]